MGRARLNPHHLQPSRRELPGDAEPGGGRLSASGPSHEPSRARSLRRRSRLGQGGVTARLSGPAGRARAGAVAFEGAFPLGLATVAWAGGSVAASFPCVAGVREGGTQLMEPIVFGP